MAPDTLEDAMMFATAMKRRAFSLLQGLVVPVLLVGVWELLSRQSATYAYVFVSVEGIWESSLELLGSGELALNFLATLRCALQSILIGSLLGIGVGTLMGISRIAEILIGPLYHTVRQVPLLGWIPLIGLWFGTGEFAKNLMVVTAVFYPMVLHTYEGIRNVEKHYMEVGQVFRFNRWQRFVHILLPNAWPSIFTGFLNALAFAWVATIGSELLFATGPGLGGLMLIAQAASKMEVVIVCIVTIGLTGYLMNHGIARIRKWLLKWRYAH
ncbi:MAG: ABC transporter permease [Zoogloeaceae bacterium]|jgi:sulfonate transport system permease protein|nr:ABC transporter permease [Zoogloeaceae bacterium]